MRLSLLQRTIAMIILIAALLPVIPRFWWSTGATAPGAAAHPHAPSTRL